MPDTPSSIIDSAVTALRDPGFQFVEHGAVRSWLGEAVVADWAAFAASWDRLGPDLFMADGGRYRRRRHAVLAVGADGLRRKPHQPHYQSRDYNPLNGGVQRWFEPIEPDVIANRVLQGLVHFAEAAFNAASPARPPTWHVEVHQFRIEAGDGQAGHPTPEGLHRDGVDWALVTLINRRNVADGVTQIAGADGAGLERFILAEPMDTALLDDRRVRHGVTPIRRLDPAQPGFRDALVVTFRAEI
jgi:hypothetical protein